MRQKTCGIEGPESSVVSTLALHEDGTFHYSGSTSLSFNDFAQTDNSGYLAQVCSKINNNQPISNTTSINGVNVQIIFFKEIRDAVVKDPLEGYTVQYFSKIVDSTSSVISKMTSAETFKIRTQVAYIVGNIMGMEEYYSRESICTTDNTKTSVEEQLFFSR
jgi:hypothetical protein